MGAQSSSHENLLMDNTQINHPKNTKLMRINAKLSKQLSSNTVIIKESTTAFVDLSESELRDSETSVSKSETADDLIEDDIEKAAFIQKQQQSIDDAPSSQFIKMNTVDLHDFANNILIDSPHVHEPANSVQLEEFTTPVLDSMADGFLEEIRWTLKENNKELVPMKGWLSKRQSYPPFSWQKRWVVIKNGYFLWNDRQISIENGITLEEKKRWSKCIKVGSISSVDLYDSKKERKFCVNLCGVNRVYVFKACSKEGRDQWMEVIKQHVAFGIHASVYTERSNITMN